MTTPPDDPWSYRAGPLARPDPPRAERRRGPAGCFLGALAFLIIAGVAAGFLWLVVARPYLRETARDELREGVAAEVEAIEPADLPVLPSGDLTLTEEEIDAHLRANAGAYGPLNDLDVDILPDAIRVRFDLYGTTSTYTGRPEVRDGVLVVADGEIDGAAGQILDPEDVSAIVEEQLTALFARSGRRPTDLRLEDGALTVTTAAAPSAAP